MTRTRSRFGGVLTLLVVAGLFVASVSLGVFPAPLGETREGDSPSRDWFKNGEPERRTELVLTAKWRPRTTVTVRWGIDNVAQPDITPDDGDFEATLRNPPSGEYFMFIYPPDGWRGHIDCAISLNGRVLDEHPLDVNGDGRGWCEVYGVVP